MRVELVCDRARRQLLDTALAAYSAALLVPVDEIGADLVGAIWRHYMGIEQHPGVTIHGDVDRWRFDQFLMTLRYFPERRSVELLDIIFVPAAPRP